MKRGRAKAKPKAKPRKRPTTRSAPKAKVKAKPRARPRGAVTRQERIAARAKLADTLHDRLFGALEMMRDLFARELGIDVSLHARRPPAETRGTPWALVGKFALSERVYYEDLLLAFVAMEGSKRLESKVHPQRLARIQVRYRLRGKNYEYTLAEIGPWELVISRAVERCNPDGVLGDSLAMAYAEGDDETGHLSSVLVWLASIKATEVNLDLPF